MSALAENPASCPLVNPIAQMGLRSSDRETPTAIFTDFRTMAVEMGLPSLATGALIGWEFLQRDRHLRDVRRLALSS
jgi:hypothetical protein